MMFLSIFLAFGSFEADNGVAIERDTQRKMQFAEVVGEAKMVIQDERTMMEHRLTSYGKLSVDPKSQKTFLYSPLDENGEVQQGKQIFFEDGYGKIYANEAVLTYTREKGKLYPDLLELKGDVRIENHWGGASQYSLADFAKYRFATKTVQLESEKEKSVLVFDTLNKLQVSAPMIEMKRDALGEEKIRGIGRVRFIFDAQEFEQFKKKFPLFNEH
jgi:CRISPR/Cas system CSM-associated protein Csm3 (group 7 of RAMP superfamily)